MNVKELNAVAKAMVGKGKGILAADESSPTIKKRFDSIATASTEENRRRYREMLFTAKGAEAYIGGVILFDETIRQSTSKGIPFPKYLNDLGMIAGIKVDTGAKALAGFPGELITEGLDGLRDILERIGRAHVHRYVEAVGVTGLGEQLLAFGEIEFVGPVLDRTEEADRQEGLMRTVRGRHDVLLDRIVVGQPFHRLAVLGRVGLQVGVPRLGERRLARECLLLVRLVRGLQQRRR